MRQLWTRAAVIALTAGTLAACESTGGAQYPTRSQAPTPNFPIVQAPPANQQPEGPSTPPDEPQPTFSAPAGSVGVSSQPLAPATTTQPLPPPPPPPVAEARPAPAPAARPVVVPTVGGPVVTIAGPPKSYKVKSGDNIDAIARTLGTTRAQLAKDNDLKSPYRIHPGLVLQGPETKDAKAYVVQTGDTMFAIAKRFSVPAAALAEENELSTGSAIRKGQKLRLPEGYRDKGPSRTTVMQPVAQGPASGAPSSGDLPPIGSPSSHATAPAPSRDVEEEEVPAGRPVTTTTVSVTGPVVEVAGPRRAYTVKRGDNIDAIARTLDTTRADLAKDNDLKAPYRINPGQKLKGPETTAKAYVVQTGDTLANVAKRFNVKPAALAEENNLRTSAAIKKGQKLRLPSGYRDKGPLKTTVTTAPPAPRPTTPRPVTPTPSYTPPAATTPPASLPSSPRPYTPSPSSSYPRTPTGPVSAQPVTPPPSSGQIIGSTPPPTEAEITAAGRGRFVWPLQGETISDFGPKGAGQRNDGVDIRAPAGTPVRAAAAGEVVYAGNQVPGFGNLVLVKHADGWVTAYAHLADIQVKMRQQVAQGATLGSVGQTGGASEPKLHFEVRYAPTPKDKARPVDPGLVLPK
jgi:murein DD-endopeptidase MepM/ murein hydrolase activator NlpD